MGPPLLRVTNLSKTFPGTQALAGVDLTVHSGEVLAVIGQNGSGKSTLVKVLAGVHTADPGGLIEVFDADGQRLHAGGTSTAGLHFIHQDLGLLPMLNTTENLDLGRRHGRRGLLPTNRAAEHRRAEQLVGRFGARIDVRAPVGTLSPAEQAIVAIARALDGWTRPDNVLILDEPTAAFHASEVEVLFEAVRRVAAGGAGVVFISHRLDEVRALTDRVVALRDGRVVAEAHTQQLDDDWLVQAIVGSSLAASERAAPVAATADIVLRAQGLSGPRLRGVDLRLRAGETVGVAGVLGSGREELNAMLFGAQTRAGQVSVAGAALPAGDVPAAIRSGLAFVPGDRHRRGAVLTMSMRENLTLPRLRARRGRLGGVDRAAEHQEAWHWTREVGLRPAEPEKPLAEFSGGNQQKVVLAKWLRTRPRVLLLDEPTQGVDIGAKAAIYQLLARAAADGCALVVCSSDAKELLALCDRVIVLESGRVVAELTGTALTESALLKTTLAGARGGAPATAEQAGV